MYKVVEHFFDLKDNNHEYQRGDEFPRAGFVATEERFEELSSKRNKLGRQLIEKVVEKEEVKTSKRKKKE